MPRLRRQGRNAWSRWKRSWRRLERAPPVLLAKRRIRQLLGRELRHFVQVHRRTVQYGDWSVSTDDLDRNAVAYSLGVGEDAVLDVALVDRYGLEVHAFDPTPRAVEWVRQQQFPAGLHFHPIGVAAFGGTVTFRPSTDPTNPCFTMVARTSTGGEDDGGEDDGGEGVGGEGVDCEGVDCEVQRLATITRALGHGRIGLLKMDVEGAEYAVLDDMLDSGIDVKQLLVEFHHRFDKASGRARTAGAVERLQRSGYRIFSISPDGREYGFVRMGTAEP